MMRQSMPLCTALLLAAVLTPFAAAEDDMESVLEKVYTSPLEARGDYDRFMSELVRLFNANRTTPAAAVIYSRMQQLLPHCTNPAVLDDFYANQAKSWAKRELPNGFLAARILRDYRKVLLRQERHEEADGLKAFASYARWILFIGPFGFDTASHHDMIFPPEKFLEELESEAGYAGPVAWQGIERSPDRSHFNLARHLYPRKGCCYALYQFTIQRAAPILLAFSSDAPAKVWLNGRLVLDQDRRKAYLPNLCKLPLSAAGGWNRVLVKISGGTPIFSLKVTDRNGYPFKDLAESRDLVLQPIAPDAEGDLQEEDLGRVDGLAFLQNYAGLHPESRVAALALADTLAGRGLVSEAIAEGERACTLAPESAHHHYDLGMLYSQAEYLPSNYRTNRARELYEKALEEDADFLPARVALAMHDHQNDRSETAIQSIREVLVKNPHYFSAWMDLAAIFVKRGWDKEFLDAADGARKLAPGNPQPLLLLARYYEAVKRNDLALQHYREALDLDRSNEETLERVAAILWDRGEKAESFGLWERLFKLNDSDRNRERLAGLHHALGDPVKAREIYTDLHEAHPLQARYCTRLGDLALDLDDVDQAAAWYGKALDLRPDLHHLREILELWKVQEDQLFEEFAPQEKEFVRNLPGKDRFPKASAICSLDHMITRFYRDGSSKSVVFQIYKMLDKNAVEEKGSMAVPGRIETLKVIKPDGEVLEPVDAEEGNTYTLPGLDIDSVLVIKQTLFEDQSLGKPVRTGPFYFQDSGCTTPFLLSRYVVAVPKGFELRFKTRRPSGFEKKRIDREGETVYVFTAKNVPVAERENYMPPDEEAFPNVEFYQRDDWTRVAQQMANGFFPALRLTEELKRKSAEVTGDAEGDLEKAKRIYAFVNDHVKEDRGSASATAVLLEGQGSRAALFMALLDAAGVAFDYLRCGLRPGYLPTPPDWSDVRATLLPNELVRIHPAEGPSSILSFDSRFTPFGEAPPYLFDAPAMKVTGRPERIETLPGGSPSAYLEELTELEIRVEGRDALIKGRFMLPGHGRIQFRESLQRLDAHNRSQLFELRIVRGIYPGAEVKRLEILGIDDDEHPPTFDFELMARDFIQPVAGKEGCRLLPVPLNLMGGFIRKAERTFALQRRGYSAIRLVMNIDFGDEYEVVELPEALVDRRFFLSYVLLANRTDKGVRIERTAEFLPADVEPGAYPELSEMLRAIDEREAEPILLHRNVVPVGEGTREGKMESPETGEVKTPAKPEGKVLQSTEKK